MKKFALLLAALVSFSGLVAVTGSSASAAVYPESVATHSYVGIPHRISHHRDLRPYVSVRTSGNVTPRGHIIINVRKAPGIIARFHFRYTGAHRYDVGRLVRGRYTVWVHFNPSYNSVFRPSTDHANHALRVF